MEKNPHYSNQGLPYLDRLEIYHLSPVKLWAMAVPLLLKEGLDIETKLCTVQASVWFDEAQVGNFDSAISAVVSMLIDPSDYFDA
jgi:hypothetical protein